MRLFFRAAIMAVIIILSNLTGTKAQSVTITDPNFLIFLQNSDVAPCLNGNQLDAGCPEVLDKLALECSGLGITDLSGIEAFVNLRFLSCAGNQLSFLPSLPESLDTLWCESNQLTSLPDLPPSLVELYCGLNQLTWLPSLPASLISLGCNFNSLSLLPTLPASLTDLYCTNNQLTSLPGLPASLLTFKCNDNQLTALPNLPASLTHLSCDNNQLTSLPSLPASLTGLYCDNNELSALPGLPTSLIYLACFNNQLTALPSLPASLKHLWGNNNQLTVLPSLPASLTNLTCHNNQLSSLPSLPALLTYLNCDNNQLTWLPSLPAALTTLNCDNNQLTALPGLPSSLENLYCANNQLTGLPPLPAVMNFLKISNNPGITCLPPIEKLTGVPIGSSIAGTGIICLPNIIQHSGYIPSMDTLPVCGIFNPNGCQVAWNIEGKVYRDDNASCAADSSEPNLQNIKLQLLQGGTLLQQVYSNGVGTFSFDTDLETYDVQVDTTGVPFTVLCPVDNTNTSVLTAADSLDYNRNFALQCKPGFDVAVQSMVQTGGLFFPAQSATVAIRAGDLAEFYGVNCNTAGLSGTVTAVVVGPVSIANVSGTGTATGNTVTWSVGDFSQLAFADDLWVTLVTDTVPVSTAVCFTATVAAASGLDNNPSNNTLTHCFTVVNSFDPNDKQVYPSNVTTPGDWHTYTVRFQNTGTAPAINVLVKDTLDQNLDWASFQLLAYSHNNLTQVKPGGIVHFNFPNIYLPDSTSNEPDSHGFIQCRIKTKSTITPGTVIHNTAAIYFDFNDPVITNDATITYCTPVETQQTLSICQGDSIQIGNQWLHQGGFYTNLFTSSAGCDSTVNTTVVLETIDATVVQTGALLTATSNATSYQWIHCNTNQPIPGATDESFAPTQNGEYAVQLSYGNSCVETSSCYNVTVDGIAGFHQGDFSLYPNPADHTVYVELTLVTAYTRIVITDPAGRLVLEQQAQINNTISLAELSNGLYQLQVMQYDKTLGVKKLAVVR